MIKPAVLDAMVAAGCTAEQIAAVVKADQASSSGATRQARYRARMAVQASQGDERDVTGVTVTHKEGFPHTPSEESPPLKEKPLKGVKKKNGSRLPDDFRPDLDWATDRGLSRQTAEVQATKFANYWQAKAGAAGVKLDWPATWRNWVISHCERLGIEHKTATDEAEKWPKRLEFARQRRQWPMAEWGPMPGMNGCRAPPAMLLPADGQDWTDLVKAA